MCVCFISADAVVNLLLLGMYVVFYSHEKKLQETKQKMSEAEKVGGDLLELKAALQELQQEGEKIKQKEEEIKKKEKVCVFSVIMFVYQASLYIHVQTNMKTNFIIAVKGLAGCRLLYLIL